MSGIKKGTAPKRRKVTRTKPPGERSGGTVRILFAMPAAVKRIVKPFVARFAALLPPWLIQLTVQFDSSPPPLSDAIQNAGARRALAFTAYQPEYRDAVISVGPAFLDLEPWEQARIVRHEILHVSVAPLEAEAQAVLDWAVPKGGKGDGPGQRTRREFERRLHEALEGVVADLTEVYDDASDEWGQ